MSPAKKKISLHLTRVQAQLKLITGGLGTPPVIIVSNLLLNDFLPKGMGVFLPEKLLVGQEVSVTIEKPKRFFCRARVTYCHEIEYRPSHLVQNTRYLYRSGVEFIFDSTEEEETVREFYHEIYRDYVA